MTAQVRMRAATIKPTYCTALEFMGALPFHTRALFFSILAINSKGVKIEGRFSFPATRSGGGERGITPDRNKRMFRRKIGDERAYLVLNLCSTRFIVLHDSTIVKGF
jgi:hypothetical protein